ncbi:MAG: RNA polymerase sigma factor [Planctomycetota bacterium]
MTSGSTPSETKVQHGDDASSKLDTGAFGALFSASAASLRVVAAAHAGREDAEDVVQEAAMIAMRKRDDFVPGTNFRAWMASIVRGVASNMRRSNRRRRLRHRALAQQAQQESDATATIQIDETALDAALAVLSHEQHECLVLKVVLGHSYRDIGTILGVPEATARSHVHRARQRLYEYLSREEASHD